MTPGGIGHRAEHIATTEEPFHFRDSGLPNLYLVGIRYYTYPDGSVVPEIPAIQQLMRLIARDLIQRRSALSGDEIPFLRKRLDQKQPRFSRAIGIDAETLNHYENGDQKLSETADKLIRLYYVMSALDDPDLAALRARIEPMLMEWHEPPEPSTRQPVVAALKDEQWELRTP